MICQICKLVKEDKDFRAWVCETGITLCPECLVTQTLEVAREKSEPPTTPKSQDPVTSKTQDILSAIPSGIGATSAKTQSQPITVSRKKVPTNRIIVVEMVYHQSTEEQPTAIETRFARWLDSEEQPFIRRSKVGEEWQPLDTGWIDTAGLILISNVEGTTTIQQQPSQQEQDSLTSRVLEIGLITPEPVKSNRTMYSPHQGPSTLIVPFAEIIPGETIRFSPVNLDRMRIRCRNGFGRYSIHVLPC